MVIIEGSKNLFCSSKVTGARGRSSLLFIDYSVMDPQKKFPCPGLVKDAT